jgi:hypothetical protein
MRRVIIIGAVVAALACNRAVLHELEIPAARIPAMIP